MSRNDVLFSPFTLNNLTIPNRIVMAPMTRIFSPDGVPDEKVAAYYRRRAAGGVGLIVTEGTVINEPAASNHANIPLFYGEKALAGWKKVADDVHAAGGLIAPQIWHQGGMRNPGEGAYADAPSVSPSGVKYGDRKVGDPLSPGKIEEIIAAYAQAAADADRLGFDAVEVHGAHGYLIDQFLWEGTNRRDDLYGGDMVGRTRFAAEIIRAIRARVRADFPVILRLSQWKQQDFNAKLADTPQRLEQFLAPLVDAGVDCFHCSTRRFWEAEFEGSPLNFAGWTKKLTGKPTITVGSVGLDGEFVTSFQGQGAGIAPLDELIERLEKNEFDLVAVGRALLSNPDWAHKVRDGREDELIAYEKAVEKELY